MELLGNASTLIAVCFLNRVSDVTKTKIIAVIPAHMASVRFPGKILFSFSGLPMIEHVRRRALLADEINDVFVATCDQQIADVVTGYGGKIIMTGNHHQNGTTRVAEAVVDIDCSHVILLQGDEPLLLPRYLRTLVDAINRNPHGDAWNGVAPLKNLDECDRHSFVKCAISRNQDVMYCFRRSPAFCDFEKQSSFFKKILGIVAFRKDFLLRLVNLDATPIEIYEFIEQMRIIEHGFRLTAVPFERALPSLNEQYEAAEIEDVLKNDEEQKNMLLKTCGINATNI